MLIITISAYITCSPLKRTEMMRNQVLTSTKLFQIIQASYFTLCLLNDIFGTNEISPRKPSSLRKFKDYMFGAFAWPLALNVGVSFWALMAIDRELVLPKALDPYFPT